MGISRVLLASLVAVTVALRPSVVPRRAVTMVAPGKVELKQKVSLKKAEAMSGGPGDGGAEQARRGVPQRSSLPRARALGDEQRADQRKKTCRRRSSSGGTSTTSRTRSANSSTRRMSTAI